jgi:hypothetical protein
MLVVFLFLHDDDDDNVLIVPDNIPEPVVLDNVENLHIRFDNYRVHIIDGHGVRINHG